MEISREYRGEDQQFLFLINFSFCSERMFMSWHLFSNSDWEP